VPAFRIAETLNIIEDGGLGVIPRSVHLRAVCRGCSAEDSQRELFFSPVSDTPFGSDLYRATYKNLISQDQNSCL
jgi:hypothetical protein